jgi:hypothetical protein
MTTLVSVPSTISVVSVTYSLPSPGQAVLIGLNVANDVRPSTHNTEAWDYSLMASYGGGCFVEDYSAYGAYALVNTGGHNHPPNFGACVFDFSDARWKRIDNSNGMPWRIGDLVAGETNGEAEIALPGVTPNSMPAPAHMYMYALPLPTALGGGPKGSVLITCSLSGGVQGNMSSLIPHRFNLATGQWSRVNNTRNPMGVDALSESPAVFDPNSGRFYQLDCGYHRNSPKYIDPSDWQWKSVSWSGGPDRGWHTAAWLDPKRNLILSQIEGRNTLAAINLANISAGPTILNKTGIALPEQYGRGNRWAYYPAHDAFYTYNGSGQSLYKLTPPASNPLTGTWTVSTVSIGGATIPQFSSSNNVRHYSRFFYVPALQCLAWISNAYNRVALIKPPAN